MPSKSTAESNEASDSLTADQVKEKILEAAEIPLVEVFWNPSHESSGPFYEGGGRTTNEPEVESINSAFDRISGQLKIELVVALLRALLYGSNDVLNEIFGIAHNPRSNHIDEFIQQGDFQLTVSIRPEQNGRDSELRTWLTFPKTDIVEKPLSELEENRAFLIFQAAGDRDALQILLDHIESLRELQHIRAWGGVEIYTEVG